VVTWGESHHPERARAVWAPGCHEWSPKPRDLKIHQSTRAPGMEKTRYGVLDQRRIMPSWVSEHTASGSARVQIQGVIKGGGSMSSHMRSLPAVALRAQPSKSLGRIAKSPRDVSGVLTRVPKPIAINLRDREALETPKSKHVTRCRCLVWGVDWPFAESLCWSSPGLWLRLRGSTVAFGQTNATSPHSRGVLLELPGIEEPQRTD